MCFSYRCIVVHILIVVFLLQKLLTLNLCELNANLIPLLTAVLYSQLCTLRGSILEEAIHQNATKHGSGKGLPAKEVLEYVCPEVNLSCLKLAQPTPKVHEQLVKVDEQNVSTTCCYLVLIALFPCVFHTRH